MGRVNSYSVWNMAFSPRLGALDALATDGQGLDRDVVALGVEAGPVPFAGPSVEEVPANLLGAGVIQQHDRAILALDRPGDCRAVPVIELCRVGGAPLQRNIGEA